MGHMTGRVTAAEAADYLRRSEDAERSARTCSFSPHRQQLQEIADYWRRRAQAAGSLPSQAAAGC
jgi:hypothetical protein